MQWRLVRNKETAGRSSWPSGVFIQAIGPKAACGSYFLRSVADMKGSEEEEEEQFIFLYHITDFKTMLILISPESLQVPYSAF